MGQPFKFISAEYKDTLGPEKFLNNYRGVLYTEIKELTLFVYMGQEECVLNTEVVPNAECLCIISPSTFAASSTSYGMW